MQKSHSPIIKHIPDFLDYIDVERGLSPATQENYARFLERFKKWLVENKLDSLLPHQLTAKHIWKYRIFLSRKAVSIQTKKNLTRKTQNFYLIALRALLIYFAEKDIASLPADKIKLAKQEKNKKINFLTQEKLEKLFSAPDVKSLIGLRDRAILETLFSTGLRVAELAGLNREQFLIKNVPDVLELTIVGKGKRTRTVYISKRCLRWIQKYLQKRNDLDKALFVNFSKNQANNETKRLSIRTIERIIKKYAKIAGISLLTTPHTLRHSFATDLLNKGVDLRLIQEFLGHQDISTTQIYTHTTNKKLRDVYLKFHNKQEE